MERSVGRALFALVLSVTVALTVDSGKAGIAAKERTRQQHACIFDQQMLRTTPGKCRPHAVAYPREIAGKVRRAIYDSALIFGVPYPILLNIAQCESSLNPRAKNSGHFGLFQFAPATFKQGAEEMRRETGITARSYWNPRDAAYVAGFLFAVGKAPSWSCEPSMNPPG